VIYVIVDEPNVPMQADSTYAQVLFRDIATEVYPYMGLYPTEEVTADLLYYLGLTYDDVVKSDVTEEQTFQVYDTYGTLYNDARINEDGVVVSSDGQPIAGVTVNADGNVVDAYWNVIEIDHKVSAEDILDPKADNPNIAAPPSSGGDDGSGPSWAGVTNEDLEDE
jgi:stage V sporulation protein D (sporulation-specific penicillin-binding protein)